ncbi:MAG: hypothetical protein KGZ82_09940 [Bacteroidales bacterium]|nr:hypothetical protein [Bacteroidales bacterium]
MFNLAPPNRRSSSAVIFLILVLGLIKFSFLQNNILSYDYFGLYLYLPATFIYHDPAISDMAWIEHINAVYKNTHMFYQLQTVGSFHLIRFFCGMAILLSPFFFLGHLLALLTGQPADGFSAPYQLAMTIAAWFYVAVGLIFIRKVLLKFFSDNIVSLSLIALYLGTNLLFWTTFDAGAPHTILFTLYAMLLWFTIRWHENPKKTYAMLIGLLLGLIIVSRPSEIIAACIPLLWGISDMSSFRQKATLIKKHYGHLFVLFFFTFLAGLPQISYYYHYTGKIFLDTYTDPQSSLDFSNPRFAWVLFSFRKGWFIYAPLMFFAVLGFFPLWKRHPTIVPALIIFTALNLFIIASFTSLISYGWRAFIQSYALLVFPLAASIAFIAKKHKFIQWLSVLVLSFFIWLSAIQGYQIMWGIIDGSRMTKAYYFRIFGKTRVSETDKKLLRYDPYTDDKVGNHLADTTGLESKILAFNTFNDNSEPEDPVNSTNRVFLLNKSKLYSPACKVEHVKITDKDYYWARISFTYYAEQPIANNELKLVCTYTYHGPIENQQGAAYKYRVFSINESESDQWHRFEKDYLSPEASSKYDQFETYLWYTGKNEVFIDDFQVKIFEPAQ